MLKDAVMQQAQPVSTLQAR